MHGSWEERLKIRNTYKQKGGNHLRPRLAGIPSIVVPADAYLRFSDLLLSQHRTDLLRQHWHDLFRSIIWDACIFIQGSVLI